MIISKQTLLLGATAAIVLAAVLSLSLETVALAQSPILEGANAARGANQPSQLFGDTGIITTVTNTLLFVAGALAVIMVIFGGLRYVLSGGNSSAVTAAKNTVMYAIIGLIIAFLAFAAVNWVLSAIAPGTSGGGGFTNV